MKILSKEKDKAKKFRAWVDLGNGKAEMVKFEKEVTDDEVLAEVERIQKRRQEVSAERQAEIDEQIAKLQAEKEILT